MSLVIAIPIVLLALDPCHNAEQSEDERRLIDTHARYKTVKRKFYLLHLIYMYI